MHRQPSFDPSHQRSPEQLLSHLPTPPPGGGSPSGSRWCAPPRSPYERQPALGYPSPPQSWQSQPESIYPCSLNTYSPTYSQSAPGPFGGWAGQGWAPVTGRTRPSPASEPNWSAVQAHQQQQLQERPSLGQKRSHDVVGSIGAMESSHFNSTRQPPKLELSMPPPPPPFKRRALSSPTTSSADPHALVATRSAPPPTPSTSSTNASLIEGYRYLCEHGDHSHPYQPFNPATWPASLPTGRAKGGFKPVEGGAIMAVDDGWIVSQDQDG